MTGTVMREGGCLCGLIRYRLEGEPLITGTCHCRTCRKVASAPQLPFAVFTADQFVVERGEPAEFRSSGVVIRSFCSQCGSPLTYRSAETPDRVDVMTCSLDEPETLPPAVHVWMSHKLSWERIGDQLPAYATTRAGQSLRPVGSAQPDTDPAAIVPFWREAGPKRWFTKDEAFDDELRSRFEPALRLVATGGLSVLEATPQGALALLLLLLDQVPRNIYRGTALAYATDPLARGVVRRALVKRFDRAIEPALRQFFYIPFQHSEDRTDQARSLRLFMAFHREHPDTSWLRYARHHAELIRHFGRFPHRNRMLGRVTTKHEQDYIDGGGFAG